MTAMFQRSPILQKSADELSDHERRYQAAERAFNEKFVTGLAVFKELALLGMPLAIYRLGKCIYYGHGTTANIPVAIQLFRRASALGIVRANLMLSLAYKATDPQASFTYCRKAADGGDADSQFRLAVFIRDGFVTDPDISLALKWFRQAKANGHPNCTMPIAILEKKLANTPCKPRKKRQPSPSGEMLTAE